MYCDWQSLNSYYYMWTWDWEAPGWRGRKPYVSMDTRFSAASRLPFHPNTATQSKLIRQRLNNTQCVSFWDKRQHQGTPSNINATELHFKGTSNNIPLHVYSEVHYGKSKAVKYHFYWSNFHIAKEIHPWRKCHIFLREALAPLRCTVGSGPLSAT